jgi:TldD protein
MPRMTNTYMLAGDRDPEEIIARSRTASTPSISAAARSTSPRANSCSQCTEAYLIENGKVGAPVKGAMLIGNGPDAT